MLVVIEGLDGAGKSTQIKNVVEYYKSIGKTVTHIHFPRYNAAGTGDMISRYLRGEFGDINSVDPKLVAYMFAEDRHEFQAELKFILQEYDVVVLDRYVYSNIAYQCAKISSYCTTTTEYTKKWNELRDFIFKLEYEDFQIRKPDINIFLDVPISFVKSRLETTRTDDENRDYLNGNNDIYESDINYQSDVRGMYIQECHRDPDFIHLYCSDDNGNMLPEDSIKNLLIDVLSKIGDK